MGYTLEDLIGQLVANGVDEAKAGRVISEAFKIGVKEGNDDALKVLRNTDSKSCPAENEEAVANVKGGIQ